MPRAGLPPAAATFWASGYAGVSLFFVLSGFILAHVYGGEAASSRPFRTRPFLVARFARIYPAYLAALCFALPAFVQSLLVEASAPAGRKLAGVCAASLTMTQAWIPGWGCWWNCPGWSLSVEAFFYLCFPLLAPALMRLHARTLAAIGLGAWIVAMLLGSAIADGANATRVLSAPFAGGFGLTAWTPLVRLPEFIVGMCAARLLRRPDGEPRLPATAGWVAAAIIMIVSAVPASASRHLLLWPGLTLPFAFIVAALSSPGSRGWLASPVLQRLGNASYSLYLIHAVGHGYLLAVVNRTVGRGYDERWMVFVVYLPLVLAASLLVHDLVEVPARRRLRQLFVGPASAGGAVLG